MWRKALPYLITASLALNLAFVVVWAANAWAARGVEKPDRPDVIWCPLHRDLGVSREQWARIEPELQAFQTEIGRLCEQVDRARSEVIELVASPQPDRKAIRAKQDDILATKRAIQSRVVEHLLAEKELLTADQQARLFQMLRRRTRCIADPPMSGRNTQRCLGQVLKQQSDR